MPLDLVDVGCHKSWFKKKKKEASSAKISKAQCSKMSHAYTVRPILLIRKKADMTANLNGRSSTSLRHLFL